MKAKQAAVLMHLGGPTSEAPLVERGGPGVQEQQPELAFPVPLLDQPKALAKRLV
jgi:hypothetical protein